jgi:hypothetical protein
MQNIARCRGYSEVAKMTTNDIIIVRARLREKQYSHKPLVPSSNLGVATGFSSDTVYIGVA